MTPEEILKDVLKLSPAEGDVLVVRLADEAIASGEVDFNSLGKMFKAIPQLAATPVVFLAASTSVELGQPRALKLIGEFRKAARTAESQNGHSAARAWDAAAKRILEIIQEPDSAAAGLNGPRDTEEGSRIITPP